MTQITIVTQNEVSIISENPLFINDALESEHEKKEISLKELQRKPLEIKNRSVNIASSSEI